MGSSSDEESEISESEIDDYSEIPYQKLQNGSYKVKVNGKLRCPFCSGKKKQDYKYKELFAHASGVSKGSSNRSGKQKSNHLALAKYLENDLAGDAEPVPRPPVPLLNKQDTKQDNIFVWPWMGIVVNPLKETDDKEIQLDSAYWLKSLSRFKPIEVNAFWIEQDLVVGVIAKFNSDWSGFAGATELEKEFENAGYSRKEWTERSRDSESKAYGWCARAEDFNSKGPIETKKMQQRSLSNIQRILTEKERLSDELDCKMKNLQSRAKLLDKQVALTEQQRQKLDEDKKKSDAMNISLQLASREQKKADESVLRLIEEHKRKTEEDLFKILELEKQLDTKQTLEMEIQELKGKLQVMKHLGDDDDEAVKEKMKEMNDELEDKKSELEGVEQMNAALLIKERESNYEIQAARKKLIAVFTALLNAEADIGVKRMGELDEKPFLNVCKQRYSADEAMVEAATLCSTWQENLKDSSWHPFKLEGNGDQKRKW